MNKLIFVVQVSILKWSYLVHGRCLLNKLYISILSVGPNETQNVPRAHQPLETSKYINSNNSRFATHCPHLQSPPPTSTRCSWDTLHMSHVCRWEICTCSLRAHRHCPTEGTFWGNDNPKCLFCPGAVPMLPNLQSTWAAKKCTSPSGLIGQSHAGSTTKRREGLSLQRMSHFVLWALKQPDLCPTSHKIFGENIFIHFWLLLLTSPISDRDQNPGNRKTPVLCHPNGHRCPSSKKIKVSIQINSSGAFSAFDEQVKIDLNLKRRESNPAAPSLTQLGT